jgi:hypothetical protein
MKKMPNTAIFAPLAPVGHSIPTKRKNFQVWCVKIAVHKSAMMPETISKFE